MQLIQPPSKPFEDFKWRWATFAPTESLNAPPVFIGVLRVFNRFENYSPSSTEVLDALEVVQKETNTNVDLVRTSERNLIRNSGQYWKALGLLDEAHGKIAMSDFGKLIASRAFTQVEFATTIIKTLELPNRRIENQKIIAQWNNSGLKIRPLELILGILALLFEQQNEGQAYITPSELAKIIIPLSGSHTSLQIYVDALIQHRNGLIDVSKWPDCTPSANDQRMAREFLIFLSNYGFCRLDKNGKSREDEQYFLSSISSEEINDLNRLEVPASKLEYVAKVIRETYIPESIERKRICRSVLERPHQTIFRKRILAEFNSTCIVTGVSIENVLEASHIIDVRYNGPDKIENGLCLRSDIHQLFDSNHLQIFPDGRVVLSELAKQKNNYFDLPRQILIPHFVNRDHLDWRCKYT